MRLLKHITEGKVETLTKEFDYLKLECDGLIRVLTYVLSKNKIKHKVFMGSVSGDTDDIPLHFWIELPNGKVVDYRLRMWLGNDKKIPNGVFNPTKFPNIQYNKEKQINMKVTKQVYDILLMSGAY